MSLLLNIMKGVFGPRQKVQYDVTPEQTPTGLDALFTKGVDYQLENDFVAAQKCYRKVIKKNPKYYPAYNNLGYIHESRGNYAKAIKWYRMGLSIEPENTDCLSNLAYCQMLFGKIKESLNTYNKLIEIDDDPKWHWKKAINLILLGKFDEGWQEYESRLQAEQHITRSHGYPIWDGGISAGQVILVTPEQGIGDEIMFSACLPEVAKITKRCIVHCDKRLEPMFKRSYPDVIVHGGERNEKDKWLKRLDPVDYEIPMGSLLQYFYPEFDRGNAADAFLYADTDKVSIWKQRLSDINDFPKIGISWRGGLNPTDKQARSIENDYWRAVLEIPGIHYVNLQYGDCGVDLEFFRKAYDCEVTDFEDLDLFQDIEDLAALIDALDLVVTVDNSTTHLAGALNKKTWTILPVVPDWRWQLDIEHAPWYPSMRLYRQKVQSKWNSVMDRIAKDIEDEFLT